LVPWEGITIKTYDAVVIGGGVIGNCVTYYLSKAGLKVALVEREDIASGTTGKSDGNVLIADKQPGYATELAFASQQLFKELASELSEDFSYTQRGSLYVLESEDELAVAEDYVRQQAEDGYPVRMMSREEIHADEPLLADDIIAGIEIGCDASINPMTFAFALAQDSQKLGAHVYTYNGVKDITLTDQGAVRSVVTEDEELTAKYVINCAGVWAPHIGRMVGLDIPIIPRQGQLLVAESTAPVARRKVVEFGYMMAKFGNGTYKRNIEPELEKLGIAFVFERTVDNNFIIGSSRAFVGYDTRVSIEVMRGLAKRAIRFYPILKDIHVIRAYAGLRPYAEDHFPIISDVPEVPGFYIAAGHEGNGIGLAPITGKLIAEMISGEETTVPVEQLRFSRFKK
jgi:glycine/D-amino acid oxidase-like deaminating enzyme